MLDAFYERGLHAWDFAAGGLIAREAGAQVGGLHGRPASESMTLAAGPGLFAALHDLLAGLDPERDAAEPATVIGAIVAAALVWFAVTAINAPGQRDDPGVTVIMGGIGVGILGVALIVLVLRMLLAQAVARDVEATQLRAELDEVI